MFVAISLSIGRFFATVLSVVIVIIGVRPRSSSCRSRKYPDVVPPTIQVTATYPRRETPVRFAQNGRHADRSASQRRRAD